MFLSLRRDLSRFGSRGTSRSAAHCKPGGKEQRDSGYKSSRDTLQQGEITAEDTYLLLRPPRFIDSWHPSAKWLIPEARKCRCEGGVEVDSS